MSRSDAVSRLEGALLGGAIGDACGGPAEARGATTLDGLPQRLRISDDTQLTLATCEAIVAARRVEPEAIAARFLAWFRSGRLRGLGSSTMKALLDLDAGAHWALAGARGERAAGNGAAMRVAPLAFVLDPHVPDHIQLLRDVCRITHHHDEAYVGALAIVAALRAACAGSGDDPLAVAARALPDSLVRDRIVALAACPSTSAIEDVAGRFGNSGYVVESVPLALWIARDAATLGILGVLERALRAGGDVDTIASLAGQVAGATLTRERLPDALLRRIDEIEAIAATVRAFADFVQGGSMGSPPHAKRQ